MSPEFATLTSDDLVTGEAVALDLPAASLGARIASGLIDVLATVALLVAVILVALVAAVDTDAALAHVALIGTLITVFLVFPTVLETLTGGRSLATNIALVKHNAVVGARLAVALRGAVHDRAASAIL